MTSFSRKAKKRKATERWNQKQNDDNGLFFVATATSISGAYGNLSIGTTTATTTAAATTMTHHNSFHYSLAVVQLVIVFPLLLLSSFTFGTVSSNASLATTTTTKTTAITRSLLAISSSLADADENDPTNHVFQYNRYLHDDEIENENDNTRGNTTTTTRHTNSLFDHSSTYTADTVCLSPPRGGGTNKNQKEDENDDNSDDNCNDEGSATAATRRTITLDDQVYLDEAEDRIRDNHMDESYSYNDDDADDGMASIINFNNASNIPLQHALLKRRKQFLKLARQKQHFLNKISQVSSLLLRRENDATLVEDGDNDGNNKGRRRKFSKRLSKGRRRSQVRDDNTNYAGKNSSRSEYYESLEYDNDDDDDDERITFQSDLLRPGRYIHIVTTAALPWFTGTAVNPLLRAAYLHDRLQVINKNTTRLDNIMNGTTSVNSTDNNKNATSTTNTNKAAGEEEDKRGGSYVTLVIPWLELEEDQKQLYNGRVFASVFEQERYVRQWLEESAKMVDAARNLNIVFYNARYHADLGSVFAMGDIISTLPQHQLDVCVLEEPEHVNWFRAPGQGWTKRYNYVVGIVHTNYDQYATQHYSGLWTAPAIRLISAAMVRAYCHKVIKLSDVVQEFAPEKEITCNVHGVRQEFLSATTNQQNNDGGSTNITMEEKLPLQTEVEDKDEYEVSASATQVYFIGKLLWTKGLDLLLEYEEYYKEITGSYFAIDIYGSGPDQLEISRAYLGRNHQTQCKKDANNNHTRKSRKSTTDFQSEVEKVSKNLFIRTFTWMNRRCQFLSLLRRKKGKKRNGKNKDETSNKDLDKSGNGHNYNKDKSSPTKASSLSSSISAEDLYEDVIDVIESLPIKAKEYLSKFPTQARGSFDQLIQDITTKADKSVKRLPAKARRAINQLIDDLSRSKIPRSLHELRRQAIPATFPGRVDHAELKNTTFNNNNNTTITIPSSYKVFVNPSVSEVLCTTTAEALAMGKFVIIPIHPSNQFFMQFENCLGYRDPYEFVANLRWALTHDPTPLSTEHARELSWEAATDRFLDASSITHREAKEREILGRSKIDERIAWFHNELGKGMKGDILRKALGAGPVSDQVRYVTSNNSSSSTTTNQRARSKRQRRRRKYHKNDNIDDIIEKGIAEMNINEIEVEGDDDKDEDAEGLPIKFRDSAFVRALREAIENGFTTSFD